VKAARQEAPAAFEDAQEPEIARRQIAAGAVGICCAKVGEAEVMAPAGIRNISSPLKWSGPRRSGGCFGVLEQARRPLVSSWDNPDNVRRARAGHGGRGQGAQCSGGRGRARASHRLPAGEAAVHVGAW